MRLFDSPKCRWCGTEENVAKIRLPFGVIDSTGGPFGRHWFYSCPIHVIICAEYLFRHAFDTFPKHPVAGMDGDMELVPLKKWFGRR